MPKPRKKSPDRPRSRGNYWQLQDAKNHLSELVRRAETLGPQHITRHGRDTAVVLSAEDYRAPRQAPSKRKLTLLEVMQASPLGEILRENPHAFDRVRDGVPRRPIVIPDDVVD